MSLKSAMSEDNAVTPINFERSIFKDMEGESEVYGLNFIVDQESQDESLRVEVDEEKLSALRSHIDSNIRRLTGYSDSIREGTNILTGKLRTEWPSGVASLNQKRLVLAAELDDFIESIKSRDLSLVMDEDIRRATNFTKSQSSRCVVESTIEGRPVSGSTSLR